MDEKIKKIEATKEKITGRGGLSLFVRYLSSIGIYSLLLRWFPSLRKSAKGQSISNLFKQLFCYFMDGTSFTMTRFDEVAKDKAYAELIENREKEMASSHAMKRFFHRFSFVMLWHFRWVLQKLFIWRLKIEKPEIIILNIDSMVMDNNDAKKKEGVKPTYKNVNGFQPLQMSWGPYIIDAVFRSGDKHCNHEDTVIEMVKHVVKKIRKEYSEDVPIILCSDSGFFDDKNFKCFEELKIGYNCVGKMYDDIKEFIREVPAKNFNKLKKDEQEWDYVEFGDRRGTWKEFRRAIFCRPVYEDKQVMFEFARPDTVIYTNLGKDEEITNKLIKTGYEKYLEAGAIVEMAHYRGSCELVNRALKDFGTEKMPFKRFESNAAFYYIMLVSFFLYESFKRDVTYEVITPVCYAETFRRKIIDIGAKIIKTAGQKIVKVYEALFRDLNLSILWLKCNSPPPLALC